jgi:hypothetical protein
MKWLTPWHSISENHNQVEGMQRELGRELSAGHPLYAVATRAIARRQDCDDVLFAVEDGSCRVAVVHLTWTHSPPEKPPWPDTVLWDSIDEWIATGMHSDHQEFAAGGELGINSPAPNPDAPSESN